MARLLHTVHIQLRRRKTQQRNGAVRLDLERLLVVRSGLLELTDVGVLRPEIGQRHEVSRVALMPQFKYLNGLVYISVHVLLVGIDNAVFLALADPVPVTRRPSVLLPLRAWSAPGCYNSPIGRYEQLRNSDQARWHAGKKEWQQHPLSCMRPFVPDCTPSTLPAKR